MNKRKLKTLSLQAGTPANEGIITDAFKFLRGHKKKDAAPTNLAVSKNSFVNFMKAANGAKKPFAPFLKEQLFKTLLNKDWVDSLPDTPKKYKCSVATIGSKSVSDTSELVKSIEEASKVATKVSQVLGSNIALRQEMVDAIKGMSTIDEVEKYFSGKKDKLLPDIVKYAKERGTRSIPAVIACDSREWPFADDGSFIGDVKRSEGEIDGPTKQTARTFASNMTKLLDINIEVSDRQYDQEIADYDIIPFNPDDSDTWGQIANMVAYSDDANGSFLGPTDFVERASSYLLDSMLEAIGF